MRGCKPDRSAHLRRSRHDAHRPRRNPALDGSRPAFADRAHPRALPVPTGDLRADCILISHAHHDHLDLPSLRRLRAGPTVLAPPGVAALISRQTDHRAIGIALPASGCASAESTWSRPSRCTTIAAIRSARGWGPPATSWRAARASISPATPTSLTQCGRWRRRSTWPCCRCGAGARASDPGTSTRARRAGRGAARSETRGADPLGHARGAAGVVARRPGHAGPRVRASRRGGRPGRRGPDPGTGRRHAARRLGREAGAGPGRTDVAAALARRRARRSASAPGARRSCRRRAPRPSPKSRGQRRAAPAGRTRRRSAMNAASAAELSRIRTRLSHCEMTFSWTFCGRWVATSR